MRPLVIAVLWMSGRGEQLYIKHAVFALLSAAILMVVTLDKWPQWMLKYGYKSRPSF